MNDQPTEPKKHGTGTYGNFSDPVGLLKRMLFSKNRAAHAALLRAGLSIGSGPLDRMLHRKEQQRLTLAARSEPSKQILVLIVGPPRSGSTLLYQTMARYFDVSCFTNFTDLFPRSPISATRLFQKVSKQTRKDFSNYYGQTAGFGAPNDGFAIWNRWLGEDRYQTPELLDHYTAESMRRFFTAWSAEFQKPFLNKNNRNALSLALLARTLPQAKFVIIRRDPVFVAQSLIEARAQVQGSKERPWGLASGDDHVHSNRPFGYVDDVCDQLLEIENRLQQQQAEVDPTRCFETTYELFCQNPQQELQSIAERFSGLQLREELMAEELTPFSISAKNKLTAEELARIKERFALTLQ